MHYIKYVLLVWVIIQSSFLKAQQYPVDVQLFVTPPYQQSLRDYWASFEPKMQVHLLLKDLNSPMRNVALRFSLENVQGQPLAQTASYAFPFQTQLSSGVRKTLSNIELKTLFAFENLQGVSEHFYNDLLPEGAYFVCFTAYDVTTQMPLSAKARTLIQIRRYTPPLPTLPAKGEIISKKNQFQHLVFQWMLRDPAPFTQYEFTLKEVWDNSLSPDEAFISGRLVYQGKVPSNTILYGTDKPILLENKRYVWKVRAFTQNPNNPNQRQSFFHNNGESEAFYFDYVSHCEAPKFLTAITKDNTANIRWSTEPVRANTHSGENGGLYKILYREKGKNWKSQMSNHPQATLIGLKRGRNYVYKVGVACGLGGQTQSVFSEQTYLYSSEQEFVTPHKQNDSTSVQCGVKPEIRIRNREPLQEVLGVNETFVAGDFPVTIIRATGSNGVFSGEGYVQVPYLLDTKIKVKFDGIKINSERQLIAGKLVTTYDKTEQNIFEVPTIKDIDSAIKIIEKVFEKQKEIIQKQEHLEKQFAENKINKEKYEQEQEKIKELITQNDKRLDVVNQYVKEIPAITEVENKNVTNQINSFKSSGSKQSFDESNADKLLTTFKNFKKRETEQFIADFERVIKDFEKKEQGKTLFLEIELDTISKKVLDHKFAEHILPDKENDYLGTYFGDFKLSKEGNTHYVWEGNYWTKIIDNGDQTYSAIVFSRVSNDIIERVTWHESDSQETIGQKIKAGKDTADFIGKFVVVAPLIMDINPTFGASKIVTRTRLAKSLVPRIVKHNSKLVKNLNLGKFDKLEDLKSLFINKNLSNMEKNLMNNGWKKVKGNWGSKTIFEKSMGKDKYYAVWEPKNIEHSTNKLPTSYWKLTKGKINASEKNTIRVPFSENFKN